MEHTNAIQVESEEETSTHQGGEEEEQMNNDECHDDIADDHNELVENDDVEIQSQIGETRAEGGGCANRQGKVAMISCAMLIPMNVHILNNFWLSFRYNDQTEQNCSSKEKTTSRIFRLAV